MPKKSAYQKTLDKLAALLRKEPLTAREIAKAMGCCRPAAYQRLAALRKRGERVFETPAAPPELTTGPQAIAYGVR